MEKTRELSKEDFLRILQLEYFSYKLRSLIYEQSEFKKIDNEVANKKKSKIIELSKKFSLSCIFDSDEKFKLFYEKEFLNKEGLPLFQYSPKNKKTEYWDKFYLLKPGEIVIYDNIEYKVKNNYPIYDSIKIIKNGKKIFVPYIYVKIKLLHTISIDALK